MYLNDIAMVAADTTRTKHYLDELIKYDLIPQYILLLMNRDDDLLPGQVADKSKSKIISLLKGKNIKYDISTNSDINSKEVIKSIVNRPESVFIFSGFGGVILGDDILNTEKKFLHVHGGYLPNYKGSTTNYYSMINENTIGASSIFLTRDIDCGPILLRKKFKVPDDRTKIDHFHDSVARSKVLIETLKSYVKCNSWSFEVENNQGGETFYVIHPVLKHLAILGEK